MSSTEPSAPENRELTELMSEYIDKASHLYASFADRIRKALTERMQPVQEAISGALGLTCAVNVGALGSLDERGSFYASVPFYAGSRERENGPWNVWNEHLGEKLPGHFHQGAGSCPAQRVERGV